MNSSRFGILNCNKPVGVTSRTIVDRVQRHVRPTKVGHAGTLDPLASGVLLIGVGAGSRLVPYLQQLPKHYLATFRFGVRTDSGDLEGELTHHPVAPEPSEAQVRQAVKHLTGKIQQIPPAYSAIKVNGQRAYDMARQGKPVELKAREVEVYAMDILQYDYPEIQIEIVCGSGTYVRSLGIDIADRCDTFAVMTSLVRTRIGPFDLSDSIQSETFEQTHLTDCLHPLSAGVPHLPQVTLDGDLMQSVEHGQVVDIAIQTETPEIAAMDGQGNLRAIMIRKRGGWRSRRGFPKPQDALAERLS